MNHLIKLLNFIQEEVK